VRRLGICTILAFLAASLVSLGVSTEARAGGSADTVNVQVTGNALSDITSSPLGLAPNFAQSITDYVWRCQSGINTIQLTLSAVSGGTITVGGRRGSTVTIPESLIENQALIVSSADPVNPSGSPVQYWMRCLPHDFPELNVTKPGSPPSGWYLTGNVYPGPGGGAYAMVLDANGTPVWYRHPAGHQAINVTPLGDGAIAWDGDAGPGYPAFEDYNLKTGATQWLAPPIPPTDLHEIYRLNNGDLMMMSNPWKQGVDMSASGGGTNTNIVDCVLQEVDANLQPVWQWRASDHIAVSESTHPSSFQAFGSVVYDPFHCNSIDTDPVSGNVLLSARHADAIYLIDKLTGNVLWKMGGTPFNHDQAQILIMSGDPQGAFHAQHDARFQPNSDVSLYDDQSWDASLAARGVEYHIDTAAGTATLVWSYESPDGQNSRATGSFRRLNGGTDNIIGWGFKLGTLFTEVDAAGDVLLNVTFPNGELAYRVVKVGPTALDHNLLRATAGLPPFAFTVDTDPTVSGTGATLGATEGMGVTGTLAMFTDPDSNASAGEYLATIAWGDGSSSPGTISGPAGGPFAISGTHTYAEEGTNRATVYITDASDPTNTAIVTSTVNVSDAPLTATATTIRVTEGMSFTGTVGSITDGNPDATAGDYSVVVAWGDGSSSPGIISGLTGGPFTISGSHTYAEEGTDTITISVTDVDSATNGVTATSTASASDALLSSICATPTNSVNAFNATTASFTDADPSGTASDYTATIAWGDGSSSSGTVADGPNGTVSGSHAYTSTGNFTITTTLNDAGGSTTSNSCNVLIYAFPSAGTFAIGNNNSAITTNVTFWGAQWWKLNSLSGGFAPASFKGFAQMPATPSCGVDWTTNTRTSTPPAGPLPTFMGVIVTSSATQSGSIDSGNTLHLVIVQTNPGYQPSPSYPGTGTVIAQVC